MRNPNERVFKVKTPVFKVSFGVQEQVNVPVESDPFPSFSLGRKDKGPHAFCMLKKQEAIEGFQSLHIYYIPFQS